MWQRQAGSKRKVVALLVSVFAASVGVAQTINDLRQDAQTPGDITTYGMGWAQQRHASGTQITPENAKDLVPAWNLSLDNSANASAQPLLIGDTMYHTTHSHTIALDPLTGRQKWKTAVEIPADINAYLCCGIHTRGLAALDGVLYRTTIDAHVMAMNAADGKVIWRSKAADYKGGYSLTHAPLVAGGVLISGISGGEYGARGFLVGWDLKTGAEKWRRYTTVLPDEKGGDTWNPGMAQNGGGSTWITGTYDPDLDLVYWGTGNGSPWNAAMRGGDSLHINSALAIRPATGEIVWNYQFSPGDPYDYDGTNELVLGDLPMGNGTTKVLMQANRNGYFYVIDRTNGKLISAQPFAKRINWADGINMATGRPIDTAMTAAVRKTEVGADFIEVWPSAYGGKNWQPMSFDPGRNLIFMNTINVGMKIKYVKQTRPGGPNWWLGLELGGFVGPADGNWGALMAWDPVKNQKVWEVPMKSPHWSGILSTKSGVVFSGSQTGAFIALDARNGKELWRFQTGSGISGVPVAWERNGQQYITVTSGASTVYAALSGDPDIANMPAGGSLWTFALKR
jgi:alcohol dehydrogenase (cytochrome c)